MLSSCEKKLLIFKKNRSARLQIARDHLNWSIHKYNLRGKGGRTIVRRLKGKRFDPKHTNKTVKFGGANIMVWGCFSGQDMYLFHIIKDTMTGIGYRTILNDVIYPYAEENIV